MALILGFLYEDWALDGFGLYILPFFSNLGTIAILTCGHLTVIHSKVYPVTYNFWMERQAENINEAMVISIFKKVFVFCVTPIFLLILNG